MTVIKKGNKRISSMSTIHRTSKRKLLIFLLLVLSEKNSRQVVLADDTHDFDITDNNFDDSGVVAVAEDGVVPIRRTAETDSTLKEDQQLQQQQQQNQEIKQKNQLSQSTTTSTFVERVLSQVVPSELIRKENAISIGHALRLNTIFSSLTTTTPSSTAGTPDSTTSSSSSPRSIQYQDQQSHTQNELSRLHYHKEYQDRLAHVCDSNDGINNCFDPSCSDTTFDPNHYDNHPHHENNHGYKCSNSAVSSSVLPLQAGRTVQVFQKRQHALHNNNDEHHGSNENNNQWKYLPAATTSAMKPIETINALSPQHHQQHLPDGSPSSLSRGEYSFVFERAYHLVEPLHLELGVIPKHYLDFAYTPVMTGTASSTTTTGTGADARGYSLPVRPSPSKKQQRHDHSEGEGNDNDKLISNGSSSSNDKGTTRGHKWDQGDNTRDVSLVEQESTCKAVSTTTSENDDDDAATTSSWWRWWFPSTFSTANSWWKNHHDSERSEQQYDMHNSAFAGGSHGEVWRGRRICKSNNDDNNNSKKYFGSSSQGRQPSQENEDYEDNNDSDCNDQQPLILKRLNVARGYRLLEAGLREVYFGQLLLQEIEQFSKEYHGNKDGGPLVTVYVDHFFRQVPRAFGSTQRQHRNRQQTIVDLELWIVFEDAGPSLRNYLYEPVSTAAGFIMYQHSSLWTQLRMANTNSKGKNSHSPSTGHNAYDDRSVVLSSPSKSNGTADNYGGVEGNRNVESNKHSLPMESSAHGEEGENGASGASEQNPDSFMPRLGKELLRHVLRQILSAAATLHEHGITHRDIKPSNVMCTSDIPLGSLYTLKRFPNIKCVLGDFSSGWDEYTNEHLYTKGPSPAEQTDEYAPPESYIGPAWTPFYEANPQSYDSWSIGVLILELLLGTPNVFSVDQRTTVLLTQKMEKEGATEDEIQHALYLAALSQFCIYVPANNSTRQESWPLRHGDPLHKTAMAKDSCTLHDFHRALRARDPLGVGFDSSMDLLLHLVWQLLAFDPMERISAAKALQHPYFTSSTAFEQHSLSSISDKNKELESPFDPRLEFVLSDKVEEFICPKCGRIFQDWRSCHRHANMRKHAKFCTYDRRNLPTCINTHSMLPAHPTSGYCDLQGRRRVIEDFHSIHLYPALQFYGIFDGHTGNLASKYAASTSYRKLVTQLDLIDVTTTANWKEQVRTNVSQAFHEIHQEFLLESSASHMDQSGTTATTLLVNNDVVIVACLGDSRAVLSVDDGGKPSAFALTKDHVASDPIEQKLVEHRGGTISFSGGIPRVNGTLAITRSIGDANLAPVLSRDPHVTSMTREEIRTMCGKFHCFVVLASDGLWDVMSNQEAVDMVSQVIDSYDATDRVSWNNGGAYQEAAEVLALEAYVRGSTDNIGVCVVAVE